jgi:hypothetical protein
MWKYGNMEIWKCGNVKMWKCGKGKPRRGNIIIELKMKGETGKN